MVSTPRVFISVPTDKHLDARQRSLKHAILNGIRNEGLEPQEFLVSGLPFRMAYNFENAREVMERCQGAVILAFARWRNKEKYWNIGNAALPTVWNHYEGALAKALEKETLVVTEEMVPPDGITWTGGGHIILRIPEPAGVEWVQTNEFQPQFRAWVNAVKARKHIFLGYSSKARATANDIIKFLQSIGVTVRDWEVDFHPGGTILDEIRDAARSTLGGIFLLTKDDDLVSGDTQYAAPRDNVIFEAGFFMQSKGRNRVLMIREQEAKMPADVGGSIYISLRDRNDITSIQTKLRDFVENKL
jgi:hypothetical protein